MMHFYVHLEHNNHSDGIMRMTINEWFRALIDGGSLYVSVPDLQVLARLLLNDELTVQVCGRVSYS